MFRRFPMLALVLALAGPLPADAGGPMTGTVVRVDPGTRVVVLEDGRVLQLAPGTTVAVDGRPILLENLQPGTVVTITTGPPAPAITSHRQVVRGVVTDVDRDGEVTIRTPEGNEFEVRVPEDVARTLRDGDAVTMEFTFQAGGDPAASPRVR
jgi:hypothetical protein